MSGKTIQKLLDQLDDLKHRFDSHEQRVVERLLNRLPRQTTDDVDELIRLHEILLFIAAYPSSARTRQLAEEGAAVERAGAEPA